MRPALLKIEPGVEQLLSITPITEIVEHCFHIGTQEVIEPGLIIDVDFQSFVEIDQFRIEPE
jgi:hypothetical protein